MMGSEQNNDYQPSEPPKPCANNCGFLCSAGTMNLCSKCYRDLQIKEEQAASAKAAMKKSLNPKSKLSVVASSYDFELCVETASSLTVTVSCGNRGETKVANRCLLCNRKVGLTGFKCKCGSTFCGTHRYPEHHGCTFDFKGTGRNAIVEANPLVKADKVVRF